MEGSTITEYCGAVCESIEIYIGSTKAARLLPDHYLLFTGVKYD